MMLSVLSGSLLFFPSGWAQSPSPGTPQHPPLHREDRIEVVATRTAEDPVAVPALVDVVTGTELEARGAGNLQEALALVAGVEIAPGGDAGPAGSVPAFMGLKEFDAFLLVVDGVPWGGAFNPDLPALSLHDVERIEVLRGPAPVLYGATSFVGVIHVVHRDTSTSGRTLELHGGSFQSGGASFSGPLSLPARWTSRFTFDVDRQGFRDDRTAYRRAHGLFRAGTPWGEGRFWLAVDGLWLDQDPASPHPRQGSGLSPLVPLDANHNPGGAFMNERRLTGMLGFDRPVGSATWSTTASTAIGRHDRLRGFLLEGEEALADARGMRQKINLTDIYVDSHLSRDLGVQLRLVAGFDYLHGGGEAQGAVFDYQAPLNGADEPAVSLPSTLNIHLRDNRDFAGAYLSSEWNLLPRVRFDFGVRANLTREERGVGEEEEAAGDHAPLQRNRRLSGSAGVVVTAWENGPDTVRLFAGYRDTFKPAAFDFGLGEGESEAGLLQPETSRVYEGGIKIRAGQGRLYAQISPFLMDFANMVISRSVNGLPALMNAGTQRLEGLETSVEWIFPAHWSVRGAYSLHNARFRDFVYEFDPGVPTQLAGHYLELSPRHLASAEVRYATPHGLHLGAAVDYVGRRFLNKRNTASAGAFASVDASLGYRFEEWDLRLDGRNLNNRRDPIAESELGDAQYYLQPARRFELTLSHRF